jgi:hypothetical protein
LRDEVEQARQGADPALEARIAAVRSAMLASAAEVEA